MDPFELPNLPERVLQTLRRHNKRPGFAEQSLYNPFDRLLAARNPCFLLPDSPEQLANRGHLDRTGTCQPFRPRGVGILSQLSLRLEVAVLEGT